MTIGRVYRHYRGGLYEVLHTASENIYLYQPFTIVLKSKESGLIYVLPMSSFTGRVFSGSVMIDRFKLLDNPDENN